MPLTFTVSNQPHEGGPLLLTITSDTPGFSFTIDDNLAYSSPTSSGRGGPSGVFTVAGTTQVLSFSTYDDSIVGDSTPYNLTGTVTSGGQTYTLNLSGVIADNDSASFTINTADPATVYTDLMRFKPQGFLPTFFDRQFLPPYTVPYGRDLIHALPDLVTTTDVAVTAYQFFTGKIPTMTGLSYLLDPAVNPNSLNSAYYANFNQENRYINFASNLGIYGEGSAAFKAAYSGLSMHDAIVKAYTEIVGTANTDAIASIESSTSYFQALAQQRIGGPDLDLSAKAAMVGYVIEEAVKAHVGVYAQSLDNFLLDLSDGTAMTGVSLVGTYGPGTFVDGQDR